MVIEFAPCKMGRCIGQCEVVGLFVWANWCGIPPTIPCVHMYGWMDGNSADQREARPSNVDTVCTMQDEPLLAAPAPQGDPGNISSNPCTQCPVRRQSAKTYALALLQPKATTSIEASVYLFSALRAAKE